MNRRSFFTRLTATCAIIALAPRLAFKDVVELPSFDSGEIIYKSNSLGFRQQLIACGELVQQGPLDTDAIFDAVFKIKKARRKQ